MRARPLLPFIPPADYVAKTAWHLCERWFKPQFYGLEHVDPHRPALYVGNHTIYGFDSPAFVLGLYQHKRIWLRGLADHFHFYFPVWRRTLEQFGAFDGTRPAVARLMQAGEHILIYPGGSREVLKNKGEAYQLMWKQRLGFIDLAIQHGYDIIPFAAIGGEETLDIIFDSHYFRRSVFGKIAQRTGFTRKFLRGGEFFLPVVTGYKHIPFLPKPVPLAYQFMPRISTTHIKIYSSTADKMALRDQIEQQIKLGLHMLHTSTE